MMGVIDTIGGKHFMEDTDAALGWSEDHFLMTHEAAESNEAVPLELMEITAGLTEQEMEALRSRLISESYGKSSVIFSEGDLARDLYMLSKGTVSVKMRLPHNARLNRLFTFTSGVIFGEMALLDGNPRSAGVYAEDDCELYRLPLSSFESLRNEMPHLAFKLMQNMAKILSMRLRRVSNEVKALEDS